MKGKGRHQIWMVLGISCLLSILTCECYGASLTIGNTVSVNGNMNATSFIGDGSRLTNVGENSTCTPITSLPNTITASGVYCLTSDLATDVTFGNAIEIATDNVVIDLNGHRIDGLAAGPGTGAYGIYANQRQNITIRNGTVRGFTKGIYLNNFPLPLTSQGHLIEDIRADSNTWVGIEVDGKSIIIRNNLVVNTGGSPNNCSSQGIFVNGFGARILNNDVIETKGGQNACEADGVYVVVIGAVVENNRIGNSSVVSGITSVGILVYYSTDVLVVNNRVTTMTDGVFYDAWSTGKYRDNLTIGCTTPFTVGGGTDAGGNN